MEPSEAYAYPADQCFHELIGEAPLSEIFTQEKMQAAQDVIDQARDTSFEVFGEMIARLQVALQYGGFNDLGHVRETLSATRDQARLFGFPFILNISDYLLELCATSQCLQPKARAVMIKLVKALVLACEEKTHDDGGEMGRSLLASLRKSEL